MSLDKMNFIQALEHCRAFATKSRRTLAERREAWRQIEEEYQARIGPPRPMPPTPFFDETEGIIDCLEFLLAVAHPPGLLGGAVEICGSSPIERCGTCDDGTKPPPSGYPCLDCGRGRDVTGDYRIGRGG